MAFGSLFSNSDKKPIDSQNFTLGGFYRSSFSRFDDEENNLDIY